MPFQDDPAIRPLFDTLNGGPPEAWKCLLSVCCQEDQGGCIHKHWICGKITKTLEGMRLHQKQVHKYTPQMELGDKPVTVASGDPSAIIGNHETETPTSKD